MCFNFLKIKPNFEQKKIPTNRYLSLWQQVSLFYLLDILM